MGTLRQVKLQCFYSETEDNLAYRERDLRVQAADDNTQEQSAKSDDDELVKYRR